MIKFIRDRLQLFVGLTFILVGVLHSSCAHAKDIRVMVVDTGIDASHLQLLKYVEAGKYEDLHDEHGHGTHVAGIISESNCPNLKIVSCKFFFKNKGVMPALYQCLDRALHEHIDIVNFSGGGPDIDLKEYEAMKKISDAGIKLIVAAGNDGKNLNSPCWGYFPACYRLDNMIEVGAFDSNTINGKGFVGLRWTRSNYGIPGMHWEAGVDIYSTLPDNKYGKISGTSQATAAYTKHLVEEMCYQ